MMVDLGETYVLERQVTEAFDRLIGVEFTLANLCEQFL
jgi:hypothetical protein